MCNVLLQGLRDDVASGNAAKFKGPADVSADNLSPLSGGSFWEGPPTDLEDFCNRGGLPNAVQSARQIIARASSPSNSPQSSGPSRNTVSCGSSDITGTNSGSSAPPPSPNCKNGNTLLKAARKSQGDKPWAASQYRTAAKEFKLAGDIAEANVAIHEAELLEQALLAGKPIPAGKNANAERKEFLAKQIEQGANGSCLDLMAAADYYNKAAQDFLDSRDAGRAQVDIQEGGRLQKLVGQGKCNSKVVPDNTKTASDQPCADSTRDASSYITGAEAIKKEDQSCKGFLQAAENYFTAGRIFLRALKTDQSQDAIANSCEFKKSNEMFLQRDKLIAIVDRMS